LKKRLLAISATYEQAQFELEIARIEFDRKEKLFKTKSISEQSYDENRFRVKGIEKHVSSLKAEVESKSSCRRKLSTLRLTGLSSTGRWIGESGLTKARRWRYWPKMT
jgi:multidrug resistance efflux pump